MEGQNKKQFLESLTVPTEKGDFAAVYDKIMAKNPNYSFSNDLIEAVNTAKDAASKTEYGKGVPTYSDAASQLKTAISAEAAKSGGRRRKTKKSKKSRRKTLRRKYF